MAEQAKVRVAVAAADAIGASALVALLAEYDSLEPIATLESADVESLAIYDADVLLWDLGWQIGFDGAQDSAALLPEEGRFDEIPVLALVSGEEQAIDAWRAGFRALLLRSESPHTLVSALHAVARGLLTLSTSLASSIPYAGTAALAVDFDELTGRELEVLSLIADGLTNKAIAHRLAISEHTVKFHVNSILNKLGAASRTEAVVAATRAGLISL